MRNAVAGKFGIIWTPCRGFFSVQLNISTRPLLRFTPIAIEPVTSIEAPAAQPHNHWAIVAGNKAERTHAFGNTTVVN